VRPSAGGAAADLPTLGSGDVLGAARSAHAGQGGVRQIDREVLDMDSKKDLVRALRSWARMEGHLG
jgi:hypothetical protein